MDQLSAMRAFVRVVETGNFTRAAQLLELPKPSVSKQVQLLESHLRTKLLNRTTRRVSVTADGAAYYERVVRILADMDELEGSMTLLQAPKGRLRVDVSGPLAMLCIIPSLPEFHERYPDIQVEIGVTDRVVDLIGENVDCVIRAGTVADQSLVARRIGEMHFITCAAPSYLQRHGEPTHPRDFEADHLVVGYFNATSPRPYPFNFSRDGERIEVRGRYIAAVNDSTAYVTAGVTGLGVIMAPTFVVDRQIAEGMLRPVLSDWTTDPIPLHIAYSPHRHLSNKLRVFVEWVSEMFAECAAEADSRTITR
jgi:DNA-binding transcriptional LysR family regulator